MRAKGISSAWALASQGSSLVGMLEWRWSASKVHLPALPTIATAQFRFVFDQRRAVLPHGDVWFVHVLVLHGFQGAECDAEQPGLADQLFDAALGVVARGQLSSVVGDLKVQPTKIPCLPTGISARLWYDLEAAWAVAAGLALAVTCKRTCSLNWKLALWMVMGGCSLICRLRLSFTPVRGCAGCHTLVRRTPFGSLHGCEQLISLMKAAVCGCS